MNNNLGNLLETYGKIVYSHKTHEKAIQRIDRKIKRLKVTQVILLSLTSAGVVASVTEIFTPLLVNNSTVSVFSSFVILLITLMATGFSIYDLSSTDKDDLNNHKNAAFRLLNMREQYLLLIVDYKDQLIDDDGLIDKRNTLLLQLMKVYEECPKTTDKDYVLAKKALKESEEYTFNQGEIELLLPLNMRNTEI